MNYADNHLLPTHGAGSSTQMHLATDRALGVDFHTPKKLTGNTTHSLPPCAKTRAYEVDAYSAAPKDWMRGNGRDRSYFVPVEQDRGMWLDFNAVSHHKKHVAVLISVQGLNPVTGLTAAPKLEQYDKQCPLHNHDFEAGRFCKDCGFKWPKQNYIATTGTPFGLMWLDGFRGADGTVRQYYFTAETAKGMAQQILGEKRVFAIGVAFFLSKTDKPERPRSRELSLGIINDPSYGLIGSSNYGSGKLGSSTLYGSATKGGSHLGGSWPNARSATKNICAASEAEAIAASYLCNSTPTASAAMAAAPVGEISEAPALDEGTISLSWDKSKLEIAAGEKIEQQIHDDPEALEFWEPEPVGTLYINYCPAELVSEILKHGAIATHADGFMQKLKVGA